jgi:NH3-dependent NAD+ synthetase
VNGKKCTTYKKKDIVEIAKKMGVDVQGKTIEKICESLKIKYIK